MKEEIMEIMREHGHSTQRAVARALRFNTDYFRGKSLASVAGYLNQVLAERRPASPHLREGLVQICEQDPRLITIFGQIEVSKTGCKKDISYHLTQVMDKYYGRLRSHYSRIEIDNDSKVRLLSEFSTFVSQYTGLEAKVNEDVESPKT